MRPPPRPTPTLRQSGVDLLPLLGTDDVVRDLDRLRQALVKTNSASWAESYGTVIGQIYADQYPDALRAMVLDGVVDPNLSGEDFARTRPWPSRAPWNALTCCRAPAASPTAPTRPQRWTA